MLKRFSGLNQQSILILRDNLMEKNIKNCTFPCLYSQCLHNGKKGCTSKKKRKVWMNNQVYLGVTLDQHEAQ